MNCQFQLTTHNEAQQENVSQVERSVKHSKIAQICRGNFAGIHMTIHGNNKHWLWPDFSYYRRSTEFHVRPPKEAR